MNRSAFTAVVATAALLLSASAPASGQARDEAAGHDWVVKRTREPQSTIAIAAFNNGITLMGRCMHNSFSLILTGLPAAPEPAISRHLILVVGEDVERPYVWNIAAADRGAALSRVPAILARRLLQGGRLQIIVPSDPGTPRTRYVVDMPRSSTGLEEVLTQCGRPLVDPRDDEILGDGGPLTRGIEWDRIPQLQMPPAAARGIHTSGFATLTCGIATGGRLSDCEIEDEFPAGAGFGLAARRAAATARVSLSEHGRQTNHPFEGRRIVYTSRFSSQ